MSSEEAAVPISGEAFAAMTVLFVLAMLAIAMSRLFAKRRQARRPRPNQGGDGGYADGRPEDRSSDQDGGGSDGGDGGGGGGGGD